MGDKNPKNIAKQNNSKTKKKTDKKATAPLTATASVVNKSK